ncbi:MAG TPA: hypothetical protein PK771_11735 [Spirochaetota bacterium]|nr:hypothetical protein [Spirochaetota bacterium]
MGNLKGINGYLVEEGSYLAKEQALPLNKSADGNKNVCDFSGTNGSIEVIAKVTADISIADTKALTLKLQHSDDGSSYYDLATLLTVTASGAAYTALKGYELAKYIIPENAKKYIKAVLTTTDASAVGSVSIFGHYIPR